MTKPTKAQARTAEMTEQRDQLEATLHNWVSRITEAEDALADHLDHAGASVLDDPDGAATVAAQGAEKAARVDLAGQAIGEAVRRHQQAVSAVLRAQADELGPEVTAAQKALTDHLGKQAELLTALEEFTGASWREVDSNDPDIQARVRQGERVTLPISKRRNLEVTLRDAKAEQDNIARQADTVSPLLITDARWAAASQRLVAAGGQLSAESTAHLDRFRVAQGDQHRQEAERVELEKNAVQRRLAASYGLDFIPAGVPGLMSRRDATPEQQDMRTEITRLQGEVDRLRGETASRSAGSRHLAAVA